MFLRSWRYPSPPKPKLGSELEAVVDTDSHVVGIFAIFLEAPAEIVYFLAEARKRIFRIDSPIARKCIFDAGTNYIAEMIIARRRARNRRLRFDIRITDTGECNGSH